jgi:hypothetical protein
MTPRSPGLRRFVWSPCARSFPRWFLRWPPLPNSELGPRSTATSTSLRPQMSERTGGRFQKRHKGNDGGRARHSSRTDAGAPVPTPRSPRARRFRRTRPLSAPLTAQVPPIRPFRPFYPLRTRCRPMSPLSPCSHSRLRSFPASPPPLTHRCAWHARTTCTRLRWWRRLLRRLLLHRASSPRRPRSSLPRRSGRCLPATAPARRMRTRPLDRCIDPAAVCSAAVAAASQRRKSSQSAGS